MCAHIPTRENHPAWVIGHRGASADYPENSLEAFDVAIQEGVDGIELDVQLSSDGVPVVYHDRTLARAGGGRFRVARIPIEGLTSLCIPRLGEVLSRFAGKTRLLIELKVRDRDRRDGTDRRLVDEVLALLDAHVRRNASILSFDVVTLDRIAAAAPELATVRNWRGPTVTKRTVKAALDGRDALSVPTALLTPSLVDIAHDLGRPVFVFTCNTKSAVERALAADVDAIMTDRPAWLRRLLAAGG